jgi:hypothetical protein
MARARLRLAVGHPDEVAGLKFIGDTQATFGVVIFGVGLLVALEIVKFFSKAPVVVSVDNAIVANLVGEVIAFIILAPLAFLLPLLMFTKKLYLAKQEGVARYQIFLTRFINAFETKHLQRDGEYCEPLASTNDLAALANIETLNSHLNKIRIVPFDLESLFRLVVAAASPLIPLAVNLVHWPRWVREYLAHALK